MRQHFLLILGDKFSLWYVSTQNHQTTNTLSELNQMQQSHFPDITYAMDYDYDEKLSFLEMCSRYYSDRMEIFENIT